MPASRGTLGIGCTLDATLDCADAQTERNNTLADVTERCMDAPGKRVCCGGSIVGVVSSTASPVVRRVAKGARTAVLGRHASRALRTRAQRGHRRECPPRATLERFESRAPVVVGAQALRNARRAQERAQQA